MAYKVIKVHKPTKLELMTAATAEEFSHLHSARIMSQRKIWEFAIEELDNEITGLTAASVRAKDRRAILTAKIAGLTQVLGLRTLGTQR